MGLWNNLIVRIKGDSTDLDNTFTKAEGKISTFASRAGSMLKGFFAVGAIVSFGKAVIGASEALSDTFSFAVAGAKGGLREFLNMVGQADFSNFFSNISNAYTKAKDLAAAFDELKDRNAYVSYVTSGKKEEAAKMEQIVKDKTGKYSLDARKAEAEKLKAIEKEIQTITEEAIDATFRLEKQGWQNLNKMTADEGVKLYETVAGFTDEQTKKVQEAFDYAFKAWGKRKTDKQVVQTVMNQTGYSRGSIEQYLRYIQLMKDGEEDVIPKLFGIFQKAAEGKTAAQERFNGVLRITNALLEEEEGIVRKSGIQGLGVNIGLPKFGKEVSDQLVKKPLSATQAEANIFYLKGIGFDQNEAEEAWGRWVDGWRQASEMAVDFISEAFIGLFESIGSGNFDDFGKDLLQGFGGLLANLGKMLVSLGTTMLLAQTLLKFPSIPTAIAAIAAGAAAMAIGGLMMGAASRGAGSLSSGGGSGGGGYATEVQPANMRVEVFGKLEGRDIVISSKRYQQDN
jgi:hypothetical protein